MMVQGAVIHWLVEGALPLEIVMYWISNVMVTYKVLSMENNSELWAYHNKDMIHFNLNMNWDTKSINHFMHRANFPNTLKLALSFLKSIYNAKPL